MISKVQASNNQPINNTSNHKAVKTAAVAAAGLAAVGGAAYLIKSGKGLLAYKAVAQKVLPVITHVKEKITPAIEKVKTNNLYKKANGLVKEGKQKVQNFIKGDKFAAFKGAVVNAYTSARERIANSIEFFKNKAKFNPQFADQASKAAETFNNFVKKSV